jgi:predicted amidohydrolase
MSGGREVRVAAVQIGVVLEDQEATTEKICSWFDEAAKEGADVVIFPELILAAGYSLGETFRKVAETPDGPNMRRFRDRARLHGINGIVGFAEPGSGGLIHNSATFVDRQGGVVGVYRKSHLFVATESFFARGSELPVYDTDIGRVGIPICYDLEFPEPARVLALHGAELLLTMTAHWSGSGTVGTPENFIRTIYSARALENRLPIVMCNRVGYDPGLDDEFCGLSRIVDSEGMVLAEMDERSEGMITATIDLDREASRRRSYDYLANRHPEMYTSLVTRS